MTGRTARIPRLAAAIFVGASLALGTAGCGGSGGGPSVTRTGTAPTDATRSRIQSLLGQSTQTQSFVMGSGFAASGSGASAPSPTTGEDGQSLPSMPDSARNHPYLGAFFQQSAVRNATAGRAVSRARKVSRQEDGGHSYSEFYYDEFLGLWTDYQSVPGKISYLLYEDEAKTKPAGQIVTEEPASYETFPQVYRSSFEFTAGYLKGSRGFSNNTVREDYSGSSEYENVYGDGGKSEGSYRWSGNGDSSYLNRDELADGSWSQSTGSFRSNGGGGTRYTTSDGYGAEYTYNPNGSGRGRITGKEPGLPATIVWDTQGNTTITYADGTVERYGYGWGFGYGSGGGVAIDPVPATSDEPVSSEPAG